MDHDNLGGREGDACNDDEAAASIAKEGERRRSVNNNVADGKLLRRSKRQKWEAKQDRQREQLVKENELNEWFKQNSDFAHRVMEQDISKLLREGPLDSSNSTPSSSSSTTPPCSECLSRLLSPYVNIKETQQQHNETTVFPSGERIFIAEGTETIRILIQLQQKQTRDHLPSVRLHSIFVKPGVLFDPPVKLITDVNQVLEEGTPLTPKGEKSSTATFHVLVGSESVLSQVAGFQIARGALACGVVPADDCNSNEAWLDSFLSQKLQHHHDVNSTRPASGSSVGVSNSKIRLLALDGVCDTANMGSMIRTASALGIDAVVLSSVCCDPWYRRSIRVSMGHVFLIPVVRVKSLAGFLKKWGSRRGSGNDVAHHVSGSNATVLHSYAAVVQQSTPTLVLNEISRGDIPSSWCCVLGNEGNGISEEVVDACTQNIRIGMRDGVDSLSVVVACGILLHGLMEREAQQKG